MKKTDIIKEYYCEDPTEIFECLSMDYQDHGAYINGKCPCHPSDNSTSFSWLKEKGRWRCWTKGCHDKFGDDIFGLIQGVEGISFKDTIQYIEKIKNITSDDISLENITNRKFVRQESLFSDLKKDRIPEKSLDNLEVCDILLRYLVEERGFTQDVLELFEVGYCSAPNALFYNRAVFPIRDRDGDLMAFTGRWIGQLNGNTPKWIHHGKKSNMLYGFHLAYPHIQETQEIILVEGPLGVLRLWQAGIMNCVAIFGLHISPMQKKLLLESGAFKVRLALDNDEADNNAMDIMMGKGKINFDNHNDYLANYFYTTKIDLKNNKDLDEMPISEVREIFDA